MPVLFPACQRGLILHRATGAHITSFVGGRYYNHWVNDQGTTVFRGEARGPGVVRGRTLDAMVELIDVPATLAELAGLGHPEAFDGRSLVPLLFQGAAPASWRQDVLLEPYTSEFSYGLRSHDTLYTELNAVERELYDMQEDPFQLDNLIRVADADLVELLSARLEERKSCRGESCRR